ncbi:anaerobic sulfite reductase subunit AsrB [Celerinatantimonas diazotrophica]|uniref:Anaerobic sulfite reductase subunit B n=1 Tax=Celerinatantimonas diazotrophica TaxID=412034 RepID=A0A4R1J8P9_9GAMM|nr:anaerobic sulfite reductase subunit AsrB [Celerinatantimonas diazotrophica]TCK46936.1 anaerobic sulfite reductase subunit B [Celerinatantimonas diazotrophica]CAG9295704.1 Anaerobic sulfite reductase subunit B [Celerinatantimonas diazotrophica]
MTQQCLCQTNQPELMSSPYPIIAIEKHTQLEWTFRIQTDLPAQLGQFVEVSLPMIGEAPISVSDCGDGWIDLLIRNVGKVTGALFEKQIGDVFWLRGSYGHGYPLERFMHQNLLVVAGGTGVAPVKGLLRYFSENPSEINRLDMILGYKNRQSVLYKDEMSLWDKVHHLIVTLDEGEADEHFSLGRVTDHLRHLKLDVATTSVIVVGPPVMIKFVVQMLEDKGFQKEQIWVDYERRMACSTGKCGHCRMGSVYVCVDGPVFNYATAQSFID